jgi:hypothetical protein
MRDVAGWVIVSQRTARTLAESLTLNAMYEHRRSGMDRRFGFGRRMAGDRRRLSVPVEVDRRSGGERRSGDDRRQLFDRRSGVRRFSTQRLSGTVQV